MFKTRASTSRVALYAVLAVLLEGNLWAQEAETPRPEHPRPDFQREKWLNLNGLWLFRSDEGELGLEESWFSESLDDESIRSLYESIQVPFPWQSKLSLQKISQTESAWYRRSFEVPTDWHGERVFVVFGAIDHWAELWLNGQRLGEHAGGYKPFEFELTSGLRHGKSNDLTLRVLDEQSPSVPSGLQTLGFTPSSGIWQTVYLEARPVTRIISIQFRYLGDGAVGFHGQIAHDDEPGDARVKIDFADPIPDLDFGTRLSRGTNEFDNEFTIPNPELWSPDEPRLYECTVSVSCNEKQDRVSTYFGLRTVDAGGDSGYVRLNGAPLHLRGIVLGGYHPDGLFTYPNVEDIDRDVEAARSFGFNTVRVRSKIEDPRFYHACDRLGCLVIQDLPSFEALNAESRKLSEETLRAAVERDFNHPSIIARVLFQDSRGLAENGYDEQAVEWVRSFVKLTKKLEARPCLVIDNIGPYRDQVESDVAVWTLSETDPVRAADIIARRNSAQNADLFLEGAGPDTAPKILGEFRAVHAGAGDRDVSTGFHGLLNTLRLHDSSAGFFYGALYDTEWDHAGLLNYDRTPKDFSGCVVSSTASGLASLLGDVFLGLDGPPLLQTKAGSSVDLSLFVRSVPGFSKPVSSGVVLLEVEGVGEDGRTKTFPQEEVLVSWKNPGLTRLNPVSLRVPDASLVGRVTARLVSSPSENGKPPGFLIAENVFPIICRAKETKPRVSFRQDDQHGARVFLSFSPQDFAAVDPAPVADRQPDLLRFAEVGYVEYRLRIPDSISLDAIESVSFEAEMSAAGDDRLLDWPEVRRLSDQPQSDEKETPSEVRVRFNGRETESTRLSRAPNDIRGSLSRAAEYPHSIYGEFQHFTLKSPKLGARDLDVRIEVVHGAGLSLFGSSMGRFPLDPRVVLHMPDSWSMPEGLEESKIIRERLGDRARILVATANRQAVNWSYTLSRPIKNWTGLEYDDAAWPTGPAAFGDSVHESENVRTAWEAPAIWLRHRFQVAPSDLEKRLYLRLKHREDVEVYLNGEPIFRAYGSRQEYANLLISEDTYVSLRDGENVLAVQCRYAQGLPFVDVGLMVEN